MIKNKLREIVERAIEKAAKDGKLGAVDSSPAAVVIEKPRLPEHGDLACGAALKLASQAKMSPIKIAEIIADYIKSDQEAGSENIARFDVAAPGFINFQLSTGWLSNVLLEIHKQKEKFGRLDIGTGQRALVEYVSANPTGDLHIGHGRNAVYGSCLSNLLKFVGYNVEQEFYVNDTGEQIFQLGQCAWAIYQRKLGRDAEYPETGYPEASLMHYLDEVIEKHKDKFLNLSAEEGAKKLADVTKQVIMEQQKKLLAKLGIVFDKWYSEESLHKAGKVDAILNLYAKLDKTYESEGAVWLKAKELGDERDRVLRKSAGNTTYLTADAAYHLDKYERGFDRFFTVWGADHHGQVPGLRAAVKAFGKDPDKMEIILTQIVNLSRDGQFVRMSKRAGTVVTLEEVMDEVGVDAVRYYLAESNPQNPINFDLELAKKTSRENPAFYVQYAHARCCALLRRALEPSFNLETKSTEKPPVDQAKWQDYQKDYRAQVSAFQAAFIHDPVVFAALKAVVMRLESFPEEVREATLNRQPGRLARYAYDLANDLQKLYEFKDEWRVISEDAKATKARLGLIVAAKQVLANTLGIIGVSAPERM